MEDTVPMVMATADMVMAATDMAMATQLHTNMQSTPTSLSR